MEKNKLLMQICADVTGRERKVTASDSRARFNDVRRGGSEESGGWLQHFGGGANDVMKRLKHIKAEARDNTTLSFTS
jgi:hypothetical protein